MFAVFLTLLAIIIGYSIKKFLDERKRLNDISKHFGCWPRNYLLGNILEFLDTPEGLFKKTHEYITECGPNTAMWGIGNYLEILISNPKDIETILVGKVPSKKAESYDFLEPWLGRGLLTSFGSKWFKMRKTLTPAFHFKVVENFVDTFNVQNVVLIEKIRKSVESGKSHELNMYNCLTTCALDNICETAMGVKINEQTNSNHQYAIAVKELAEIIFSRWFGLLNQYPTLYNLTPSAKREKELVKIIQDFISNVIIDRRQQLALEVTSEEKAEDEFGVKTRKSFMDLMLQTTVDGEPLSNESIQEEVNTFMFAGHDTTTSAMCFTLYNLALHSEVQEKVFEEQKSLFGNDFSTIPNYNDLQEMKYLEMVIKETMRLHCTVPFIGREAIEPIQVGSVKVPPGINLNISIYSLHRNPKIYPNPEQFNPDRFTEEAASKRGAYDFIPFSAGNRNCIGQRYAMLEIKSVLSSVLRNFKVKSTEKTEKLRYAADLVLRPIDGLFVDFEERKYKTKLPLLPCCGYE